VLRDLGLVDANAVPDAADIGFAEETVASEVAFMASDGIRIWNGSDQSVPLEYLTALSRRIGLAVAPAFGLITIADAELAIPLANEGLRRLSVQRPIPLTLVTPRITGRRGGGFNFTSGT